MNTDLARRLLDHRETLRENRYPPLPDLANDLSEAAAALSQPVPVEVALNADDQHGGAMWVPLYAAPQPRAEPQPVDDQRCPKCKSNKVCFHCERCGENW